MEDEGRRERESVGCWAKSGLAFCYPTLYGSGFCFDEKLAQDLLSHESSMIILRLLLCSPSILLVHPSYFRNSRNTPAYFFFLLLPSSLIHSVAFALCSFILVRGEVLRCCVHFGRGASVTVIRQQVMVVVVVGLAVNSEGKVLLFDLLLFCIYNLWIDNP